MGGRKIALRQLCQIARSKLRSFSSAQPALASHAGRDGEPIPDIKPPKGPTGVIHVRAPASHLRPSPCLVSLCAALTVNALGVRSF